MVWVRYAALAANAGVLVFLGAGFVLDGAPANEASSWVSLIGQAFIPALSLVAIRSGKIPEVRKFKTKTQKRKKKQQNLVNERTTKQEQKDAEHRTKLLQNYKSRLTAYSG